MFNTAPRSKSARLNPAARNATTSTQIGKPRMSLACTPASFIHMKHTPRACNSAAVVRDRSCCTRESTGNLPDCWYKPGMRRTQRPSRTRHVPAARRAILHLQMPRRSERDLLLQEHTMISRRSSDFTDKASIVVTDGFESQRHTEVNGSLQAVGVRKSISARGSLQGYAVSKGLRARGSDTPPHHSLRAHFRVAGSELLGLMIPTPQQREEGLDRRALTEKLGPQSLSPARRGRASHHS